MLKFIHILLAVTILYLSLYSLFYLDNSTIIFPIFQFASAVLVLVMGVSQLRAKNKKIGALLLVTAVFLFIVLVISLL